MPPQHGAWAMLLLPYLAAVLVVGARWPHLPLLGAWLGGYLVSYYASQAVKTRRPGRFRAQLVAYAAVTAPLAAVVVAARPDVLWYAPAFAALLAVTVAYAWRRRERALGNDLALVALSSLMIPVAATVAGASPSAVGHVLVAVPAYFLGTVFHVKSMIRERGNPVYRWASVTYHLAAVPVAAWISLPLGAVFTLLLVRAWVLPRWGASPLRLGVLEIVLSLCVLAAVVAV
ncbi:MAG: YwiC-like family protein [Micromonosporaceae bacterium]